MAKQKRKPAAQPTSIIRHPLFPAVVALWFGALFGLGSLAIRTGLFESLVIKLQIDTLIPAAAPPLGITAKICIALTMAVLGGALGGKLAKLITRPNPDAHQRKRGAAPSAKSGVRRRDAHPDAPARRPISAHEEFGDEGIETESGPVPIPGRRRALTVEQESSVFTVPEFAPLPGGAPQVIDLGELDLAGNEIQPVETELPAAIVDVALPPQDFAAQSGALEQRQVFGQPVVPGQQFAPPPPNFVGSGEVAEPPRPIANYGAPVAPPIDFSRPSDVFAVTDAASGDKTPLFQRPVDATVASGAAPDSPVQTPISAETVAEAAAVALDSLGLVELTERFAATLRKRREALAASTAAIDSSGNAGSVGKNPDPAVVREPGGFSVPQFEVPPFSVPESAVTAEAEQNAPREMPAALRPISFDDLDEDEDFATYLPLRHIPMPQANPGIEPEVFSAPAIDIRPSPAAVPQAYEPPAQVSDAADEAAVDGYSSLLDVAKPTALRQEFVRIDEPEPEHAAIEPVVIFPGQAARQEFAAVPPVVEVTSPARVSDAGPLRRFDAPSSAAAGQPVAAPIPGPTQDSEETERALRAALATLQRMSGAA